MDEEKQDPALMDPLLALLRHVPPEPAPQDVDPACMKPVSISPKNTGKDARRPTLSHGPLLALNNTGQMTDDQLIAISGNPLLLILSELEEQAYYRNRMATTVPTKKGGEIVAVKKPMLYVSPESVRAACGKSPGDVVVKLEPSDQGV